LNEKMGALKDDHSIELQKREQKIQSLETIIADYEREYERAKE